MSAEGKCFNEWGIPAIQVQILLDPLMQPYVLMRGLQKGLIDMSDISSSSRAPSLQGSLDIGDT